MKVIIFDGLDNTGKSTQIQMVADYYESTGCAVCVKHFSMPPAELSNDEKIKFQNKEYSDYVRELIMYNDEKLYDYVLIDRCWYSEYVYGQMYRERDELELLFNIYSLEESLLCNIGYRNVKLFIFSAHNPEFMVKHEDGLSISAGDIEKIAKEMTLFTDIYNQSNIFDKYMIRVNKFFKSEEFIDKMIIFDGLKTTINAKHISNTFNAINGK